MNTTSSPAWLTNAVYGAVSEVTGYALSDLDREQSLEGDLGLDSIKTIELMNTILPHLPEHLRETFHESLMGGSLFSISNIGELEDYLLNLNSPKPQMAELVTETVSKHKPDMTAQVFGIVAQITGYAAEELGADMFLESDLGLDSIKTVELMNALAAIIPDHRQAEFLIKLGNGELFAVQTLRELLIILGDVDDAPTPVVQLATSPTAKPLPIPAAQTTEIAFSQYPFLVSHWAVCSCSLSSGMRLEGEFSAETARLAWSALLLRHPMLRARFVIPEQAQSFKDYRLEVLDGVTAPAVEVQDLRHLAATEQEAFLSAETNRLLNKEWSLEQWPVHNFKAFQLAEQRHEILFANHHVFSDGLSNQQIMREFISLYGAIADGQEPDLAPATSLADYQQTVANINQWTDPETDQALAQFLRLQGKSKFLWDPQQQGAPNHTRADNRSYRFNTDKAVATTLLKSTKHWRLPVNTLLVGAYLRAISNLTLGLEEVILNIPTSGRVYPGLDAAHQIGCFAQNLALTLPLPSPEQSWQSYLPSLHEKIEAAIASGYDRSQTRQTALASSTQLPLKNGQVAEPHASFIRSTIKSNLYLPYIGQTHINENYGPLQVLDYHAATSTNPGTLDVLVEVFQGRFNMAANYDAAHFPVELIKSVADEFIRQIDDLARASMALLDSDQVTPINLDSILAKQLLDLAGETLCRKLDTHALNQDLESDLGMDSLERIRLVGKLRKAIPTADTRSLLACRRLSEMAEVLKPEAQVPDTALPEIPYLHIAARCHEHPEALAILDGGIGLSYGQLNSEANQLSHYLKAQGIGPGSLVGLMLPRSAEFAIAVLAILKAGAAYVPIDPDYPSARIAYMIGHSQASVVLTLNGLLPILAETQHALAKILIMDVAQSHSQDPRFAGCEAWLDQPSYDPECSNTADDLMVVLYTSGSTGTPKGVALAHRGYMNRMHWQQDLFGLQAGERVAQKTSICFDISVWELFWPLMNGGTICPVAHTLLRDPWQLAEWVESNQIAVMHFVPSLFNEFLMALEGCQHRFESLRWLIFSGEALPVSLVQNWFDQRGDRVGLANLYGPTEASIDVTAHLMHSRPPEGSLRIPIGMAMPAVHILILDEQLQPVPDGQVGELWIGGIQLAQGYLYDPDRSAENFRSNPFPQISGAHIYRTGDLAVRLEDGSFDYRGRIDNQIKIRGFRVELGEIEAAIDALPGIFENAVLAHDSGDGNLRLVAWLAGTEISLAGLRGLLANRLPEYMLPQQVFHAQALPKNHNGKLDRNILKSWTTEAVQPSPQPVPVEVKACLAPAQNWINNYFDSPYDWLGYTRHQYLQPLNIELFQQALNILARRHPVLRTLFVEEQGRLKQILAPEDARLNIDVYDISHLDLASREPEIRRLVAEKLAQLRFDRFPLWRVLVVKTAKTDCYDIAVVGHHLISDLVSNNILFREVWHVYGLLSTHQTPQTSPSPASFQDYIDELNSAESLAARQSYLDYWLGQFQGAHCKLSLPYDHQLGNNDEASSAMLRFVLPKQAFQSLSEVRKHFQSNLYALLLAPAYRVFGEWSQQNWVALSHRSHGRDLGNGRTFYESVGNFAVNYPLGIELAADESWRALVGKINQAIADVPLNGISYDLVGNSLPATLYPDDKLTPVRVNYLGNRSLPKSDIFSFDEDEWDKRYAAPQQRRTALIEIFIASVEGELRIDFDYSANFFSQATMQWLGDRYCELLNELIESAQAQPTLRLVSARPSATALASVEAIAHSSPSVPPKNITVALVTGASRGIGRAIAIKLASTGTQVVLTARSRADLEAVAKEITDAGGSALAIAADITDAGQVQALVDQTLRHFGKLDILVNNAGITGLSALATSDPDAWKRVIEVNLFGTYNLCRAVTPQMIKQGHGKIVNLGSDSSFIGYPLFSAYAASKHGLIGLTNSLAEELKPYNIQVNAVCPAFVDTEMTPAAFRAKAIPSEAVADAVAFLTSAQAQWITGESVKLYGRQDMYWFGADKMAGLEAVMGLSKPARAKEESHG